MEGLAPMFFGSRRGAEGAQNMSQSLRPPRICVKKLK